MAQGDVQVYSAAKLNMGDGNFSLSTGPFKVMIQKTSFADPTENDSDPGYTTPRSPQWDSAACEVIPGGTYTDGGQTVDVTITDNWTLTTNVATFDVDDITVWTQNGSNPVDAEFALMYQDDASDFGICSVELGGNFDMTTGDLSITWNSNGVFTLT